MSKLTLEDIDWSVIPSDVEYISEDETCHYKDIINGVSYKVYSTSIGAWWCSQGTPTARNLIKRPTNIFTKSMLVAGKHIVETAEVSDNTYTTMILDNGNIILENSLGYLKLDEYNEDLTLIPEDGDEEDFKEFNIIKVYTKLNMKSNKLIWERTPTKVPTQKELQLAALQDTINKAQEQIEELMKED